MIDLQPTIRLHEQIIDIWRNNPSGVAESRNVAVEQLYQRGVRFERGVRLRLELSAMLLSRESLNNVRAITEKLHGLIERVLGWMLESVDRMDRFFPDHRRMFPHLQKCPGLDTWQGYSRYDAVITSKGELKIIELNTGCPAGLFGNGSIAAEETLAAIQEIVPLDSSLGFELATIPPKVLVDSLLSIEAAAAVDVGLIAVLYDENGLSNQLDELAIAMREHGRDSTVMSASDLTFQGDRVYAGNKPVSLTFNKFRISTAESPNHCWRPGFADRYQGLLTGIMAESLASVNNLLAMSIAEDKSLMGLFFHPEVRTLFDEEEQEFIDRHILWTTPLGQQQVLREGELVGSSEWIRQHRKNLVVKPANEGRGFGITIGRYADERQWNEACRPNAKIPQVVQEYADPLTLPIVNHSGKEVDVSNMFVTLGLGVIRGAYQGMMSRISTSPVTNVARDGMVQAVFLMK